MPIPVTMAWVQQGLVFLSQPGLEVGRGEMITCVSRGGRDGMTTSRGDYMKRREICLRMSCQRIGQRRFGRSASSGSWMNEGSSGLKSSPDSFSSSSIVTM